MSAFSSLWDGRWYFVALALVGYAVRLYRQYAKLRAFAGPRSTTISNIWMVKTVMGKRTHLDFANTCAKYGPLARIAPDSLITSSPELVLRMSAARSPYTKSVWYQGSRIQPGSDNVFSQIDEKAHNDRRAQMAPGYSGKDVVGVEKSIDHHLQGLMRLIRTKYLSNNKDFRPMDLARKAQFFTLDVITDIAFGQPFGDLEQDEDLHKYVQSTEEMLEVIILLGSVPILTWITSFSWVQHLAFPSDKDAVGVGKLVAVAKQLLSERFSEKATPQRDMIQSFINHGLNKDELVSESLLQILAGSDTSATAIRATMLHLMATPPAYARLQAEIDEAVNSGRATRPIIRSSEGAELPYMQAVIKEGLRIFPPVTGLLSKLSPPDGDHVTIDGKEYFIPPNTQIAWSAWAIQHDKDVFGADADTFRPERWLEADPEVLKRMERVVELIWGYGKYQCLGRPIAMIELNKVYFELLRNFDFTLVNPMMPWKSANVGLWQQSEEWVRVVERQH